MAKSVGGTGKHADGLQFHGEIFRGTPLCYKDSTRALGLWKFWWLDEEGGGDDSKSAAPARGDAQAMQASAWDTAWSAVKSEAPMPPPPPTPPPPPSPPPPPPLRPFLLQETSIAASQPSISLVNSHKKQTPAATPPVATREKARHATPIIIAEVLSDLELTASIAVLLLLLAAVVGWRRLSWFWKPAAKHEPIELQEPII